jgi:hypothetical protein
MLKAGVISSVEGVFIEIKAVGPRSSLICLVTLDIPCNSPSYVCYCRTGMYMRYSIYC